MTPGRSGALAAHLVGEMRSPLARIELAASQLAREAATPLARQLAAGISEAVADLDQALAQALGLLRVPRPRNATLQDVRPAFGELSARLAPTLAARGITLELREPASAPVLGEPQRLRRAATQLLRAGAARCGAGGWLQLALVESETAYGLELVLRGATDGAPCGAQAESAFEAPRAFALQERGALERSQRGAQESVRLWLPRGDESCGAS